MEFARSQLTKHGWSEGEGLGKNGEGISKAIKIPLKKDNTGVGYNHSADFTNHWWSTAFDDALKNISIIIEGDRSEDVNPLPVKDSDISALKTKKDEELVLRKVTAASDVQEEKSKKKLLLFGAFQKGSKTLQMEKESLLKTASSPTQCVPSDGTNLREGDMTPSYIERNRHFAALSDDQLLEACGGRTAHKAARHGLKMGGKLKRLADQEHTMLKRKSCRNNPSQPSRKRNVSKVKMPRKQNKFHTGN